MSFKEISEYCQAQALLNKLSPDEIAIWRYFARSYSKKFNTPLHLVMEMAPEEVMLHHYEEQMDDLEVEDHIDQLLDMIYSLEDPDYEQEKSNDFDTFIENAELEEQERLKKGKPIHPALRNESSLSPPEQPKGPSGGSINLSYLAKEEE